MKTSIVALFALVLTVPLVFAGPSTHDESKSGQEFTFTQVDTNTNGSISVVEARKVEITDEEFKAHDANADNQLSQLEYLALTADRMIDKKSDTQTQ